MEDILNDRRDESDFSFATQSMDCCWPYKHSGELPKPTKRHILTSERVKAAIEEACSSNHSTSELEKIAGEIYDEMSHNLSMTYVRVVCFALIKIFKRLYTSVYANGEQVSVLKETLASSPVVLLPTHRSYLDFLIVSYVFYHYKLPLPAIAAAIDFLGMNLIGEVLRNCGAFFIQRSFRDRLIYWAVFSEYVTTCLPRQPMEFFVEGTRSRTNKALPPKTGMLSVVVEQFLLGKHADIMLVPISISYERVMEESLYAAELTFAAGKPKESTSGLLQAWSILGENYGSVYCHVGEPMSLRALAEGRVCRSEYSLTNRFKHKPTVEEEKFLKEVAIEVLLNQLKHQVISVSAVVACLFLYKPSWDFKELVGGTYNVYRMLFSMDASVDIPIGDDKLECRLRTYISDSKRLYRLTGDNVTLSRTFKPRLMSCPSVVEVPSMLRLRQLMHTAELWVRITNYRNQLLNWIIRPGLVLVSSGRFSAYSLLVDVLSREFIFHPKLTRADFDRSCQWLRSMNIVCSDNFECNPSPDPEKMCLYKLLHGVAVSFLVPYIACIHSLVDAHARGVAVISVKAVSQATQKCLLALIDHNVVPHLEMCSLNIPSNCISMLFSQGMLKRNDGNIVFIDSEKLKDLRARLSCLVDFPWSLLPHWYATCPPVVKQSKL